MTLVFATSRPTRTYRIQTGTILLTDGAGGWVTVGEAFLADPGTTTRTISFKGGPRRFFRVVAQRPL